HTVRLFLPLRRAPHSPLFPYTTLFRSRKPARYSAAAQASERPSKVLVPRPTSSINTRLASVALCRILAVSLISTMKVERPPARSSLEPMRVNMRSIGDSTTRAAGTWEPIWASSTMRAVWRMRSEEHTSELQSRENLVCRLLLEKKKKKNQGTQRQRK